MATKPWDSRLAHFLVSPLRDTPVHPNLLTTLGLMSGLAAANLLAGVRGERLPTPVNPEVYERNR